MRFINELLVELNKYSKNLNNGFIDTIIELARYLRGYKYSIAPSCLIEFVKISDEFDIFDLDDFYGISKSLFCKNQMEYSSYYSFFRKFINQYVSTSTASLIAFEKEAKDLELKELKDNLEMERLEFVKNAIAGKKEILDAIINGQTLTIKQQKKKYKDLNKESKNKLDKLIKKENNIYLKDFLSLDSIKMAEHIALKKSFPMDQISKGLNTLMMDNLSDKNYDEGLNELLVKTAGSISKIHELYSKGSLASDKKLKEKTDENQRKISEKSNELKAIIKKLSATNHRNGDFNGKNAIQELINMKDIQINKLNEAEYSSLMSYIKLNSSKFRTVLSRSMKQSKNKVFDYKTTMAKSIEFYGEPMKLYYKKPIVKKYKLVCIMDISGSVAKYIKLLSSFLYEINSAFNGGVHIFGFVSDLINFTELFNNESINVAIECTKGHRGYSDYYKALSDFNEDYLKIVDRNTVVMFFGDARNNKNESGVNFLREIKERCNTMIWLNPEMKSKWGNADSIIYKYKEVVDQLYEILEVKDLIDFMENISLSKKC